MASNPAFSTPPRQPNAASVPGLKPLTLTTTPRTSSQPSPSLSSSTGLARSNSTNSRRAPTSSSTLLSPSLKRPLPKRLSSISYSVSPTVDSFSAAGSSSSPLRSAPILDSGFADATNVHPQRPGRPSSLPSPNAAKPASSATDDPATSEAKPPASVLTLAERHADLLRFIAAKESKCLELRTQLEQHESELLVLKTKWERIINKSKSREIAAATAGRDASSSGGDVVVEALKGVGRYLGGLALPDESTSVSPAATPQAARYHQIAHRGSIKSASGSTKRSASPGAATVSSAEPSPSARGAPLPALGTDVADPWRLDQLQKQHKGGRNSPSPSSPSSSALPSSTRDSLSSVSTAASSLDLEAMSRSSLGGGTTPTPHDRQLYDPLAEYEDQSAAATTSPWIPLPTGFNKKWEQMQKNGTFEKHSKRASLLISDVTDMSNSILGSLSSALLSPPSSATSVPIQQKKARPMSMITLPTSTQKASTFSFLDEDDEDAVMGGSLSKPILPSGLSPVSKTPATIKPASTATTPAPPVADTDEDDWNW